MKGELKVTFPLLFIRNICNPNLMKGELKAGAAADIDLTVSPKNLMKGELKDDYTETERVIHEMLRIS